MGLPINLPLSAMQTKWKADIDPVLSNPMTSVNILKNISLIDGTNTINHLLGRQIQGWFISDIQGAASIYRPSTSQFNDLTLTLISSSAVICSIGVF